jgi:lipopolysaccharide/colanic/teichoic acid biosynthesis glycosyltransferase
MPRSGLRRYVLDERLFASAIVREQKRTDRSEQPLVLMVVSYGGPTGPDVPGVWNTVFEGLSAVTRESDVVGWMEPNAEGGVILTESQSVDGLMTLRIETRLRRWLSTRLDRSTFDAISIRFQVYAGLRTAQVASEPSLAPLPETPRRASAGDAAKRVLDIAGSSLLLLGLSPLFLAIAALIKLKSPGPVFFRQSRIGQDARPFTMLKFRTMHVNNDPAIHQNYVQQFIQAAVTEGPSSTAPFKITNDPRVTPIGHLLRKTSLDELPQLLNVFRGDMSLVGPRPPIQYEVDQYKRWHTRRVLDAKPGVTGLWQVTGRSRTTFDEMVRLDLRYARKRSFWTDVKILLATPRAVIAGKGAC